MTDSTNETDSPEFPFNEHNATLLGAAMMGHTDVCYDLWDVMARRWPEDVSVMAMQWIDSFASASNIRGGPNVTLNIISVPRHDCGHDHAGDPIPDWAQWSSDLIRARVERNQATFEKLINDAADDLSLSEKLLRTVLMIGVNLSALEQGEHPNQVTAQFREQLHDDLNTAFMTKLQDALDAEIGDGLGSRVGGPTGILSAVDVVETVDPGECVDGNCTACNPAVCPQDDVQGEPRMGTGND